MSHPPRSASVAKEWRKVWALARFVMVCLLFSLPSAQGLADAAVAWADPLTRALGPVLLGYRYGNPAGSDGTTLGLQPLFGIESLAFWGLYATFALPLFFLAACMCLLHVFPTYEPTLARRFGVPWGAMAVVLMVFAICGMGLPPRRLQADARFLAAALISTLGVVLLGLILISRIVRLASARLKSRESPEVVQQARLALLGVRLGFLLLLLAVVLPDLSYSEGRVTGVSLGLRYSYLPEAIAIRIGLVLPFAGFLLAIMRRGLWDVDLVINPTATDAAWHGWSPPIVASGHGFARLLGVGAS